LRYNDVVMVVTARWPRSSVWFLLLSVVAGLGFGCSLLLTPAVVAEGDAGPGDADADVDPDGDADADADADTDPDGEGDGDDGGDDDGDDPCTAAPATIGVEVIEDPPALRVDLGAPGLPAGEVTCTATPEAEVIAWEPLDEGLGAFAITGTATLEADADATGDDDAAGLRLCDTGSSATLHTRVPAFGEDLLEVAFSARNHSLAGGMFLRAEVSTDGVAYTMFAFVGDDILRGDAWQRFDLALTRVVSGYDEVWLRFTRVAGDAANCADVDDVSIVASAFTTIGEPLLSEDFEVDHGVFVTGGPAFDTDIVPVEGGGRAVEVVCSSDGNIAATIEAPALGDTGRLALVWRWRDEPIGELTAGKYVVAEVSDDGTAWRQVAAIGLGASPGAMTTLAALLPRDLSGDVHVRFIAPDENDNDSWQGALVDDVEIIHVDQQLDVTLGPFADGGDGTFEADLPGQLHGWWKFRCDWVCSPSVARRGEARASL
jgi:hypothetical protein